MNFREIPCGRQTGTEGGATKGGRKIHSPMVARCCLSCGILGKSEGRGLREGSQGPPGRNLQDLREAKGRAGERGRDEGVRREDSTPESRDSA